MFGNIVASQLGPINLLPRAEDVEEFDYGMGVAPHRKTSHRRDRLVPALRSFDEGRIESGQLRTVAPVDPVTIEVGDIVLCRVRGNEYLHIVKAIQDSRYQTATIAA